MTLESEYKLLTITDGGSFKALAKKGNLDTVRHLYNPLGFFRKTYVVTTQEEDLEYGGYFEGIQLVYVALSVPRLLKRRGRLSELYLHLSRVRQLHKVIKNMT